MKKEQSQNDFYTRKAKESGYPARSIFKLKEIDEKFKIFKKGDRVLDLGSAPGSWLLYLSAKVGENGKVIGVDTKELNVALPSNCFFFQKDVFAFPKNFDDRSKLLEKKFNAVVSDLAPKTSGIREKDNFESFVLSKRAFEIAKESLLEKGSFICKIFESPEVNNFLKEIKPFFKQVHLYKTKATPKGSREAFIVCLNFVG